VRVGRGDTESSRKSRSFGEPELIEDFRPLEVGIEQL
jgi:hypothetical protein